jgi:hypothetical protein
MSWLRVLERELTRYRVVPVLKALINTDGRRAWFCEALRLRDIDSRPVWSRSDLG